MNSTMTDPAHPPCPSLWQFADALWRDPEFVDQALYLQTHGKAQVCLLLTLLWLLHHRRYLPATRHAELVALSDQAHRHDIEPLRAQRQRLDKSHQPAAYQQALAEEIAAEKALLARLQAHCCGYWQPDQRDDDARVQAAVDWVSPVLCQADEGQQIWQHWVTHRAMCAGQG